MSMFGKRGGGSHYYTHAGEPMHTVIGKNGRKRNTTIADCRKLGLLPSVTNVLGIKAKPALTTWIKDMAILAAITSERQENETDEDWGRRIAQESDEVTQRAAEFGTAVHKMIEDVGDGYGNIVCDERVQPYVAFARQWFEDNVKEVISQEAVVVGDGYAGRADLFAVDQDGVKTLFDFKTKQLRRDAKGQWKKPQVYPEWTAQLAAYGKVLGAERVANVVINAHEPCEFITIYHKTDSVSHELETFNLTLKLWQHINKYKPETIHD